MRAAIRRRLSLSEQNAAKRKPRLDEEMPWPKDYGTQSHNSTPLARFQQEMEVGRVRRAGTMRPDA